jgi:hypothetical protein
MPTGEAVTVYFDRSGEALGRLLGENTPAVWLRGAERLPSLSEVTRVGALGSESTLFLWRVVALKHSAQGPFEHHPCLARHECFRLPTVGQTSVGSDDHASLLAISTVSECSQSEFSSIVSQSTFPRLWGAFYGGLDCVPSYAAKLSTTLCRWGVQRRSDAERAYVTFLHDTSRTGVRSVVVVVDSNMRHYWVVPQSGEPPTLPATLTRATCTEFAHWQSVGWDVKRLERSKP